MPFNLNSSGTPSSRAPHTWEHIHIKQIRHPAGEGSCLVEDEHTLFMSLLARPIRLLQVQSGSRYSGLFRQGDMSITPANTPIFVRWDNDDHYLQIRLKTHFIENIARETLKKSPERLELLPKIHFRHPEIETLCMMLLKEAEQAESSSGLYIDSLANVLAVNLLKHYASSKPEVANYEGGLPQQQLRQVLDYIHSHLDQEIKLSNLAGLLKMSQFHFSRLFKQSIGISPHQYLMQQRIERAKQLLQEKDRLIVDIAFECGFNSHSHLSKQFRQATGMTPKAFREI